MYRHILEIFLYIYMCVCICMYTHACMHACMHTYIRTYVRVYTHTLSLSLSLSLSSEGEDAHRGGILVCKSALKPNLALEMRYPTPLQSNQDSKASDVVGIATVRSSTWSARSHVEPAIQCGGGQGKGRGVALKPQTQNN